MELHELGALEQAAAVRSREVGAVELVEHHLRRVEGERIGAFVTVTAERALDRARAVEQVLRATADPAALPPLLGVPTAIKDLTATAGVPTGYGSAVLRGTVPAVDDDVVVLLREAGTISLGKTSTPEFGLPCYTEPAGAPPAVTPWDPTLLAGGSSGGAAAAVAGRLVPFAQGSDGAGSIRAPAAACGLVGLKPSRGRVSRGPQAGDVTLLSVLGPLARTVADAAALLDAMAVPRLTEPVLAPPLPPGETFLAAARRDPGPLVVGRYAEPPLPGTVLDPRCRAAWEAASDLLANLGHDVRDTTPPFDADVVVPAFEVLWAVGSHGVAVPAAAEERLQPFTRWLRERGRAISGPKFLAALARLQVVGRAAIAAHSAFDVVLTPALAQRPRPVGWFTDGADPTEDFARQKAYTPYTALYNVTGQPAVSLPVTAGDGGPPLSVQLVGRPGGEATVLAVAAQLEAARAWTLRWPS